MAKDLRQKAIKIQGKDYVLVSDRVIFFNETYPAGCIIPEIVEYSDQGKIVMKAHVYPEGVKEGERVFTGHAQEIEGTNHINKTSALENAETSAVGRALAMMGIGVIDSIASVDEIKKAKNREKTAKKESPKANDNMTKAQKNAIFKAGKTSNLSDDEVRQLVSWKATKEKIDPNGSQICGLLLGKDGSGERKMQVVINEYTDFLQGHDAVEAAKAEFSGEQIS